MTSEVGQFELGALIGEGAYGKVFECFDTKDGKKKVCRQAQSLSNYARDKNCCQRFQKSNFLLVSFKIIHNFIEIEFFHLV